MKYNRIKLSYDYDNFEPYIDKLTMQTHYEKHHQAYETKLNQAIENISLDQYKNISDLLINIKKINDVELKAKIMNFGGGLANHNFFFTILKKDVSFNQGNLDKAILKKWDSFDKFKDEFSKMAITLFGSGWVWLVKDKKNNLKLIKTANQDSPLAIGLYPIIGIDVWEHAFYLKYKSNKVEYVENFWNVINWEVCEKIFNSI